MTTDYTITTDTYNIITDCDKWQLRFDPTIPTLAIMWREDRRHSWKSTPYQSASANCPRLAAELVAAYLGDCVGDEAEEVLSVSPEVQS